MRQRLHPEQQHQWMRDLVHGMSGSSPWLGNLHRSKPRVWHPLQQRLPPVRQYMCRKHQHIHLWCFLPAVPR
jgi:hypothetical protein